MKERIKSIDSLRGLAILAVILIHTTTRTLEASNFDIYGFSWTLYLNQISRFAVPLFLLISGFVLELSAREESYWSYIKRRISKIFIPYFIWSVFYYLVIYNNNHDNFQKVILTGNASYQLYFVPSLIVFYLTFPFIHNLVKRIPNKVIFITVSVIGIFLLSKNYYLKAFDLGDYVNTIILGYYYFLAGILASRNKIIIDKIAIRFRKILPVIVVIVGAYIFWEGKSRYLLTGNYLSYYSQWRPSVLVYTILVSLTFYYLYEYTKFKDSIIARFSKHSFFAFFVHVAILEGVWKIFGKDVFSYLSGSALGRISFDAIFFGIVVFASFLVAFAFHKIKNSSKLFG